MIPKDEAEALLEPYFPMLREPFPLAWKRWDALGEEWPEVRRHLSARARANLIYDWAASHARLRFEGMEPTVRLVEKCGFLLVIVHDRVHLRFKKFARGMRSSGIATQQQMRFAYQQPTIPGLEPATIQAIPQDQVALQTEIERTAIVCSTGSRVHWHIDLREPEAEIVAAPAQPAQPDEPASPALRSTLTQEEAEETGS
jgi:hypothetical protein